MELKILGSSSLGNCYILDNGKEALIIECGVKWSKVKKALNFDVSRIVGVLVSHEHQDHAREVKNVIQDRIPLFMSEGTADALGLMDNNNVTKIEECEIIDLGGFGVQGFEVEHDAEEPFGFLIHHNETGTVLFATDTYYLAHTFNGLNNILIECNYSLDLLDANIKAGRIPQAMRKRTIKSHCSFDTCKETLLANDLSMVNNIVLIHLSDGNSNAKEFQQGIQQATLKTVHIAEKDMTIKFDKSPF